MPRRPEADDGGIVWEGIAALGYDRWAVAMDLMLHKPQPKWDDLHPRERAVWVLTAQEISRVAYIAAAGG